MKYYKVLMGDQSCHGGSLTWPLPKDGQPGEWVKFEGELDPCCSGIHLTSDPAKWYDQKGLSVYEAEFDGDHETCSDDKIVCRNVRLMRLLSPDELANVNIFLTGSHEIKQGNGVAYGSATVRAYGSATVRAYGSATVRASDSATVEAYDSATVRAYDSATVEAYGSATVEASDSATVEAYGSATVNSYHAAKVSLSHLSIQIDRSAYGQVVVRRSAGAAVTLEDASTPTGV